MSREEVKDHERAGADEMPLEQIRGGGGITRGKEGLGTERCNLGMRPYTLVDKESGKPDLSAYGKLYLAAALFTHTLPQRGSHGHR